MFNTIVSVAQAISAGVGGMLMSKMSAKSQAAYAKAGGIAEENLVSTGILGCFLSRAPPGIERGMLRVKPPAQSHNDARQPVPPFLIPHRAPHGFTPRS